MPLTVSYDGKADALTLASGLPTPFQYAIADGLTAFYDGEDEYGKFINAVRLENAAKLLKPYLSPWLVWGRNLPAPARPAPSLVDIAPVVGVIEVDFFIVIIDIVLDSIGTLIPSVAAKPRGFQVVNVRAQPWTLHDLVYNVIPFAFQVGMCSQKSSDGAMKPYLISWHG